MTRIIRVEVYPPGQVRVFHFKSLILRQKKAGIRLFSDHFYPLYKNTTVEDGKFHSNYRHKRCLNNL